MIKVAGKDRHVVLEALSTNIAVLGDFLSEHDEDTIERSNIMDDLRRSKDVAARLDVDIDKIPDEYMGLRGTYGRGSKSMLKKIGMGTLALGIVLVATFVAVIMIKLIIAVIVS
jgi:hypothetical protein